MKCPTCDVDLVMADRLGVEIDYCPKCRGIWLDRGELDKIIERSAAQVPAPPPAQAQAPASHGTLGSMFRGDHDHHGHDDHHGSSYGSHGKKSFWQQILD